MAQVEVGVAKGVDGGCYYGDADNVEYGAGFDLHTNCERAIGCARVLICVCVGASMDLYLSLIHI